MSTNIALVGNPNCGKSLLFNTLTGGKQHVGNWPSVTVEQRSGVLRGYANIRIQDLPGIYSLDANSLDEVITMDYLRSGRPNAIINVIDATNLERGLYLTLQLLDLGIPTIIALNMMDAAKAENMSIDCGGLSSNLGCPVVPVSALHKTGIEMLKKVVTQGIDHNTSLFEKMSSKEKNDFIKRLFNTYVIKGNGKYEKCSARIDSVLTNRYLGFPIFSVLMYLIYAISITGLGKTLAMLIKKKLFGVTIAGALRAWFVDIGIASWLTGLVVDGIVSGVGSVLRYTPRLLLLFLFISILEDSGYMARVAFLLDRLFRRFGLSGKSFIPLFVSTGCAVPGIMASKTIENQQNRRITIMTSAFMPCGMKMAVVALFAGSIFGGSGFVAASVYFVGLVAVLISGLILKKLQPFEIDDTPFIMELPNYHIPSIRNVWRSTWERTWSFIKRAGTIILLMSVVIWFFQKFGVTNGHFGILGENGKSILAYIGGFLAPIFVPLGFGFWQAVVATISGFVVKESIVSSLGILYGFTSGAQTGAEIATLLSGSFTQLSAYSFLLFNLLCMPCFGAVGAIRREMNNVKWTWATIGYQFAFAYAVSLVFYQFGLLFAGNGFHAVTAFALVVLTCVIWLVFRKDEKVTAYVV